VRHPLVRHVNRKNAVRLNFFSFELVEFYKLPGPSFSAIRALHFYL